MTEKYRPRLHFSPASGWMNDPNGMVMVDGLYHLFFQHDPQSIEHGPMHWGHAVSTDLCHWAEWPVALHPDALGTCFSGSAVRTPGGDIKLLYTAHGKGADGRDLEAQCLVHADPTMTRFTPHPANPVLRNPGLDVFRDPKVVWHEETGRWIMVVTLGQEIGFYSSMDLAEWRHESSFGKGEGRHGGGVWECPDLLPMTAPDGSTLWVLIVSLSADAYGPGSGTQYFIGRFDGRRFVNANAPATELWLDYGRDCYAPQTFFGEKGATPVAIAWASNWSYARQTPTRDFRGMASLPRELRLVETAAGLRLAQTVPAAVRRAFAGADPMSGTFHCSLALDLATSETAGICLFGERAPQFRVHRTGACAAIIETERGRYPGMSDFAHRYDVPLPCALGEPIAIDLFVDRGMVELSAGGGLVMISNLFFPDDPQGQLRVDLSNVPRRGAGQGRAGPITGSPGREAVNREEYHYG